MFTKSKNCERCGNNYKPKMSLQKYCEDCQPHMARQYRRNWWRRNRSKEAKAFSEGRSSLQARSNTLD